MFQEMERERKERKEREQEAEERRKKQEEAEKKEQAARVKMALKLYQSALFRLQNCTTVHCQCSSILKRLP